MSPAETEKTVLVVDDEPEIRRFVQAVLRRQGYAVVEAEDGYSAFELLQRLSGGIQVMVTDVRMPGMDGITLGQKVGADYPNVKVLYMSGFLSDPPKNEIPFSRFLQKPFAPDVLVEHVRAL